MGKFWEKNSRKFSSVKPDRIRLKDGNHRSSVDAYKNIKKNGQNRTITWLASYSFVILSRSSPISFASCGADRKKTYRAISDWTETMASAQLTLRFDFFFVSFHFFLFSLIFFLFFLFRSILLRFRVPLTNGVARGGGGGGGGGGGERGRGRGRHGNAKQPNSPSPKIRWPALTSLTWTSICRRVSLVFFFFPPFFYLSLSLSLSQQSGPFRHLHQSGTNKTKQNPTPKVKRGRSKKKRWVDESWTWKRTKQVARNSLKFNKKKPHQNGDKRFFCGLKEENQLMKSAKKKEKKKTINDESRTVRNEVTTCRNKRRATTWNR